MSDEPVGPSEEPSATAFRWLRALKLLLTVLTLVVGLWKALGGPLP